MSPVNNDDYGDVEDLLPWHATGTLSAHDARRVEAALASDPELARRYELVREELGQTVFLSETLGAPSPRAFDALLAKIDAEPAWHRPISINLGAHVREFFATLSPRTLAWSASAAALAILLQAGVIASIMLKEKNAGGYETASAPATIAGGGAYALIRFRPQANAAEITTFLEANKLTIADGPSAGGLYRIRISPTIVAKDDRDRIVKSLQENPVVNFIAVTE